MLLYLGTGCTLLSMDTQPTFTTGQLAKACGVGPQTLRYYERRGLLPAPPRTSGGRREYGKDDLRRIRFIRRAQELGFQLDEILELLELRVVAGQPCHDVADAADLVVARINEKIGALEGMKSSLLRLRTACDRAEPTGPCPVLDALERDDHEQ